MILEPPKYFGIQKIDSFISSAEFIYKSENKQIPNFIFDLSKMKSICLLGQLLLYKFISYTAEHHCFKNPEIMWNDNQKSVFNEYGFYEIMKTYIQSPQKEDKILKSYKNIKFVQKNDLLIAPQRLLRRENSVKDELELNLFQNLKKFYISQDAYTLVSVCVGELLSNFWSHATKDSGTVMVAYCHQDYFEICFADNGDGVISTLKNSNQQYKILSNNEVICSAIEKGVTSKPGTDHMGLGLYFLKNICKYNNGQIRIYSEGSVLDYTEKSKNVKNIGYWKGTIIYLKLNLAKIVKLSDIPELKIQNSYNVMWG